MDIGGAWNATCKGGIDMLTKEECEKALDHFEKCYWDQDNSYGAMNGVRKDLDILNKLIHEHFSNPPLSLNEVRQFWHEGIPVWDTELEEYVKIHDVIGNEENGLVSVEQFFFESISVYQYHSKRFYRKEVQE